VDDDDIEIYFQCIEYESVPYNINDSDNMVIDPDNAHAMGFWNKESNSIDFFTKEESEMHEDKKKSIK